MGLLIHNVLIKFAFTNPLDIAVSSRVAKCHGYGGFIRVKKLEGWGKMSGRIHSLAKSIIVLGKFEQLI